MTKRDTFGIFASLLLMLAAVVSMSGCTSNTSTTTITETETITVTKTLTPTTSGIINPAKKFGEAPYLIIEGSPVVPSNKVEEWHKMEIINYTMKVEEGEVNKYEVDIYIWIRNTYNLPVDWVEVDVEFINEWNQTYIESDIWYHFIRPNETAKTYIHTAGEYIPQIKEIYVWGHEHHP